MKRIKLYLPEAKGEIIVGIPDTPEEAIKLYENKWILFSDMLAQNVPFYYFIHTVISTNRDLNKGFIAVKGNKICMLPLVRTALENTLLVYAAFILKDMGGKLDTFTKRYIEGKKISTITISLPPEVYNQFIKNPDEVAATKSKEVPLTNANLSRLLDASFDGIRSIYLECCSNIHPTKEQLKHYLESTGYIGDRCEYTEAITTPEEIDSITNWLNEVNTAMLVLLERWQWCYHHTAFNSEVNGTKEIKEEVNKALPLEKQPVEELIANAKGIIESTSSNELKGILSDFINKKDRTIK